MYAYHKVDMVYVQFIYKYTEGNGWVDFMTDETWNIDRHVAMVVDR